ncbi:MAG: hypothetical protein AAFW68_00705 [Pseudomonadota bacterium]
MTAFVTGNTLKIFLVEDSDETLSEDRIRFRKSWLRIVADDETD